MKTYLDRLSEKELIELGAEFKTSKPYNHLVIDNFLDEEDAHIISEEFPSFDDNIWYSYDNPLEIKKATNNWNHFQSKTYQFFSHVLSPEFNKLLERIISVELKPDIGLHGGGYHCHGNGGKLNPHIDYSIHPKINLQRRLNLIVYITPKWKAEYGGSFGLWENNIEDNSPGKLYKEVDCLYNRAVLFDTTQNSWHGLTKEVNTNNGLTRNSLATYYLAKPIPYADEHMKVKYAPTEDQIGDEFIEDLIKQRQSMEGFKKAYRKNDK